MRIAHTALILASVLALSACEDEAAPEVQPAEIGGEATGDVLEGTISDNMIPLEKLTSTSPPAERAASTSTSSSSNSAPVPAAAPEPPADPIPEPLEQTESPDEAGEAAE